MGKRYACTSKVTVYPGMSAWRFLGLREADAKDIRERFGKSAKGWGSIPVSVTIGNTTWRTSIFPDKKSGSYVLPLRAEVRKKEGIQDGDAVSFDLTIG